MNISKIFFTLTSVFLLLFVVSCGPVKFSSSSNQPKDEPTDPVVPPLNDPNDPNNPPVNGQTRDVTTQHIVQSNQQKVDILLIVDNSSSMNADNIKLADRLTTFVSQLESSAIDWQMCLVVTTFSTVNNYNYWGLAISWGIPNSGSPHSYTPTENWILKRQSGANLPAIFRYTLENNVATGSNNTNDERGIKSAYWHAHYKDYNKCYRPGAAFAQIYISDEDERSVGGVAADKYYTDELRTLEDDDSPSALVDKVKEKLGATVRFRANSIIVKPTDTACLATQDAQGTKAHYGRKYEELSKITGGGIGSICDTDYYNNLNFFNEVINDSLESMPLECNPVSNNVSVTITPTQAVSTSIQGQSLIFNPSVQAGSTIVAKYKCSVAANNRVPNSVGGQELGFWAKIVNFFKSLF
jgi:hypothetical protein